MSEHSKQVLITFLVVFGLLALGVIIYFAGMGATRMTNNRLDHIGTECVKAGHLWINNECVPGPPGFNEGK